MTDLISIGKLAKQSGFAVERIRMWELRYGRPIAIRLPSGHRRYSVVEVDRLNLIRAALNVGKRPRHIMPLAMDELQELMAAVPAAPSQPPAVRLDDGDVDDWIEFWSRSEVGDAYDELMQICAQVKESNLLRLKLREYGRHKATCGGADPQVDCTCGLRTLLKED